MKVWIFAACAAVFLFAVGTLMVRSNRTPWPEAASEPTPPLSSPAVETPAPAPVPAKMTAQEFQALGQEVAAELPTNEDLTLIQEQDAFAAPPPIVKAGHSLEKLAKAAHENPELEDSALLLFKDCAGSEERPESVRALCLHYFRRSARKNRRPTPEGFAPYGVRNLADKLAS